MTREQLKALDQKPVKEKVHIITWASGEVVEKPAVWRRSRWSDDKFYGYFYKNGIMTKCVQVGTRKWMEAE